MKKTYACLRVYNNDSRAPLEHLEEAKMKEWKAFNAVMRFGCALFVDGKNVFPGYLAKEHIERIERENHQVQPITQRNSR